MADDARARIVIRENGPYLVSGTAKLTRRAQAESIHGEPLDWDLVGDENADYETKDKFALCRCGESSKKPYCDGTHARTDFDGELTADRAPGPESKKTFEGDGFMMTEGPMPCASAGFCGTRYANVWGMIDQTSDPEVRDRVKRMLSNCPAGRMGFTLEEGGEPVEPEFEPSIATIPDGPLWVRGGIEIEAPDGFVYETPNRLTLCRCGHSKSKPFCDGAHKEAGFTTK